MAKSLKTKTLGRISLILWHIEVHPHENALATDIHIIDAQLGWHGESEAAKWIFWGKRFEPKLLRTLRISNLFGQPV